MAFSCKKQPQNLGRATSSDSKNYEEIAISYATGFRIQTTQTGYYLTIKDPWPDSQKEYTYKIVRSAQREGIPESDAPVIIKSPIQKIILTSTTHIPPVSLLDEAQSIIGYPGTDYISDKQVRRLIDKGTITELGTDQSMSVERVVSLQPQLVMGYGVTGENPTYTQIQNAGIPVLFNGDWTEQHPLGRAEWIKVFGILYNKEAEANRIFKQIEADYIATQKLVATQRQPEVIAGATYKDVWYLPYGNSWQGKLINDAAGNYIYKDLKGTGSIAYNMERLIKDGQQATIWIAPGQYTSYKAMLADQPAYALFTAFKNKQVYTFGLTKGAKGGVTYYEEASMRPDIVLKDLVTILHPELQLNHKIYFFKPLTD